MVLEARKSKIIILAYVCKILKRLIVETCKGKQSCTKDQDIRRGAALFYNNMLCGNQINRKNTNFRNQVLRALFHDPNTY